MLKFIVLLLISSNSFADNNCDLISNQASTLYVFCPPNTTPEKMSESISFFQDKHLDIKTSQIHIYIFNNKGKTPKTGGAFAKMSDSDIEKYQTGIYDLNKITNHKSFMCKKLNKKQLENCNSFLKK